ncbi:MAG: membrane protein [Nitrosomonas sp.]|nr:MAG: membrane protein [Nitrosomonas sp.]
MGRIASIDWMRGIVMILMALDHASGFFNEGRLFADSILLYETGTIFATDQFLTRWITHICAPTFVFLAGTGVAINTIQRRAQGISNAIIDRDILIRGAFIALLDLCVLSLFSGKVVLQVLYAIGISMMLMVLLRRLSTHAILLFALAIIVGGEMVTVWFWDPEGNVPFWLALTFAPSFGDSLSIIYPFVPWLAMMMLGWVFGEWLMKRQDSGWSPSQLLMVSGIAALICFVLIRAFDGYGNMLMYLEGDSIVQWLHVSKYPPSLAYTTLELGLMAVILALFMWLEPKIRVRINGPVLVYGQTALFFYLAHFCVLAGLTVVLSRGGLEQAYLAALLALILLYPVCRSYRTLKRRYPQSVLRYM